MLFLSARHQRCRHTTLVLRRVGLAHDPLSTRLTHLLRQTVLGEVLWSQKILSSSTTSRSSRWWSAVAVSSGFRSSRRWTRRWSERWHGSIILRQVRSILSNSEIAMKHRYIRIVSVDGHMWLVLYISLHACLVVSSCSQCRRAYYIASSWWFHCRNRIR